MRNTADGPPRPGGRIGAGDLVARYRPTLAAGYALLVITLLVITDRFDRPTVLAGVLGGMVVVAWRNPRPWARFLMDWMPLFVILVSYDLIRAQADSLIPRAHLEPQRSIDEFIGGGTAPSVRLQADYFRPNHLHWYDYALFCVYLTHFVAAIVVGAVLYMMNRERFRRFAKIFLAFSLAGYLTYVVYPAIPPWLASKQGALPHTARAVHTIWDHLGLEFMEKVFSGNPAVLQSRRRAPERARRVPAVVPAAVLGVRDTRLADRARALHARHGVRARVPRGALRHRHRPRLDLRGTRVRRRRPHHRQA